MCDGYDPTPPTTATRRRFLQATGAGALTAVGSVVVAGGSRVRSAHAQEAGDAATAAFLESVELALVEGYGRIAPVLVAPEIAATVAGFAAHHEEHAAAVGALAGAAATGEANPGLLDDIESQLDRARDEHAVLEVAYLLETGAAATYLFAIGVLEATGALELAASILIVESEHAVVFGTELERPVRELAPSFVDPDAAFRPGAFPIDT